jgi:hypothetical protein
MVAALQLVTDSNLKITQSGVDIYWSFLEDQS